MKEITAKFETLINVMFTLRSEDGCPWDRAQSLQDLRQYLLEEAYEVLQAMDHQDYPQLMEELGDLLFQIVFQAQMMQENRTFTLFEVVDRLISKMVGRHPHVFGELKAGSPEQALDNWESMKDREKASMSGANRSILEGIPLQLPALLQALMISSKVVRVGFEWETEADVWKKVEEEIQEFHNASTNDQKMEEMGDLLFTIVNVARKNKINPEDALRAANLKFRDRFMKLEKKAYESDRKIQDLSLQEMDEIWEQVKVSPKKD